MTVQLEDYGTFCPRAIAIRTDPMLRIQGYAKPDKVRPAIRSTAETMAVLAGRLFVPEVYYRRVEIKSCGDDMILLETGTTFHSDAFAGVLHDCREIIVFILTLGINVDQVLEEFAQKGQTLEALLLETAGWLGVETATKSFTQHLRAVARKQGYRITRRFGPGYSDKARSQTCHWPLEDQKPLFALFAGVSLSVKLLDSCAMIPKMSRSGLYGLRPCP